MTVYERVPQVCNLRNSSPNIKCFTSFLAICYIENLNSSYAPVSYCAKWQNYDGNSNIK